MFSFHHVSLSVRNLEESISFYEVFGFESVFRWQAEDEKLAIVHLKMNEVLLELFCFEGASEAPESSKELATDLPRIGIKHFGLRVDDIHAAKAHLQDLGLAEGVEVVAGKTGIQYFFVKDPSGILVEVVQDDRGL